MMDFRSVIDRNLEKLEFWPGLESDGRMYKNYHLFAAVLNKHRNELKPGKNFVDETQFYTNILDTIFAWIHREMSLFGEDDWRHLQAYGYLIAAINFIGAEQARLN